MEVYRGIFYKESFPNTYTLKMTGVPLQYRLHDGLAYVSVFFRQNILLISCLILFFITTRYLSIEHILFASCFVIAVLYHLWIGGDSFGFWRLFCPALPFVIVLAIQGLSNFTKNLEQKIFHNKLNPSSIHAILMINFFLNNLFHY